MGITEVYKVVRVIASDSKEEEYLKLCSAIVIDKHWQVEYLPDVWVSPRVAGSKLTCFDTLENARLFVGTEDIRDSEIWRTEAENVEKGQLAEIYDKDNWDTFWLQRAAYTLDLMVAPQGTLLADRLKLIEREENK